MSFINVKLTLILIFLCSNIQCEKPKLNPSPSELKLFQNSSYVLTCSLVSGTIPVTFEWFFKRFNDVSYESLKNNQNTLIDNSETLSLLKLTRIEQNSSGFYECRVFNSFGTDSVRTQILVKGFDS